jgi:hypothetical protein
VVVGGPLLPIIVFEYGLNRESRIFDNILYAVDGCDIPS